MADILTAAELDAIRGRYEAGVNMMAVQEVARDRARLLSHVAALDALLSTAARELELSCYTDEAVTYQANKQRRLDLAARIRAALGTGASATDAGAVAGEAGR